MPEIPSPAPRRKRKLLKRLALFFSACLFALLLAELLVRIVIPQDLSGTWRVKGPGGYRVNRAGGSVRHEKGDTVVHYRFNEHHLRGGKIPETGLRVLVLGDSFAFGWLLEQDETTAGRLQSLADEEFGPGAVHILNGGAGGWGAAHYVAFVEDYGEQIRPDVVVALVSLWDVGRSLWGAPVVLAGETGLETRRVKGARDVPSWVDDLREAGAYQWFLQHSHLVQLLRNAAVNFMNREHSEALAEDIASGKAADPASGRGEKADEFRAHSRRLGQALFLRLHGWCESHGADLAVVNNGWDRFGADLETGHRDRIATLAFEATAQDFFRDLGVPYIDLAKWLHDASGGDLSSLQQSNDAHPSARGASAIAEGAWKGLRGVIRRRLDRAGGD